MEPIKLLIAGEGGQGIQTIAKVIAEAAALDGKEVTYIPSFGVEQRGTPSLAYITISNDEINYPRFQDATYVVILQSRAVKAVAQYVTDKTKVIIDSSTIDRADLPKNFIHVFGTPATQMASEKFTPKAFNVLICGKLSNILNLKRDIVWQEIAGLLGKKFKDEKIRKANEDAFHFGWDIVFEIENFSKPTFKPSEDTMFVKGFDKKGAIMPTRCKGCGICILKCPTKALSFSDTLGVFALPVPKVDLEKCITCGNCTRFCPDAAIHMEKIQNA